MAVGYSGSTYHVRMKLRNTYYIMRHGQAISNVKAVCSCWPEKFKNHLTAAGVATIKESAEKLQDKKIDLIFASPLLRTKETAEIVGKELHIKPIFDRRLREIQFGIFNDKPLMGMWKSFKLEEERIKKHPLFGENYEHILARMLDFLKETDQKYNSKHILIISHEGPLFLLQGYIDGLSFMQNIKKFPPEKRIHKGEIRELN